MGREEGEGFRMGLIPKKTEGTSLPQGPPLCAPSRKPAPCLLLSRSHSHSPVTDICRHPLLPLKEVMEIQSGLWLRTFQSPWGQIRWCGIGGGHGRPQAAFPGGAARLTRSQGLGCTAETLEASLPHLSGGGKPGTPETQWEGEKRAAKRTPRSPLSCCYP